MFIVPSPCEFRVCELLKYLNWGNKRLHLLTYSYDGNTETLCHHHVWSFVLATAALSAIFVYGSHNKKVVRGAVASYLEIRGWKWRLLVGYLSACSWMCSWSFPEHHCWLTDQCSRSRASKTCMLCFWDSRQFSTFDVFIAAWINSNLDFTSYGCRHYLFLFLPLRVWCSATLTFIWQQHWCLCGCESEEMTGWGDKLEQRRV